MGKLIDDVSRFGLTTLGALGEIATEVASNRLRKAAKEPLVEESSEESSNDVPGGKSEDTTASNPVPTEKATEDPKSLMWDPYAIIEQLGYKDRPSPVTYGTLKTMTWKMPVVGAIIQTRVNQVASFCNPSHNKYEMGFRVKLRDTEKEPTAQDKKWAQEMESIIMRTGVTDNPRGRDNFENFLRKYIWDSLVYDQAVMEIVPNRKGLPAEWYAVDAATVRLADSATTFLDEDDENAIRYVQIYDGMIIAEFTDREMAFGVRNPRTDIRLYGYGVSELEMLIPTITNLLYGFEYNSNFFKQGSAAKGIINFKGVVPEKQLQGFRRQWYNQISGVHNSFRTPITNSEDLQWINLQSSNRDMEFSAWLDFQIKLACGLYLMDPIELNFKYGNTGQKAAMAEENNKEKITESKERGLTPLLRFLSQQINENIIWQINESFEFSFVGLNALTKDASADLNQKRVKTIWTVDELRAEEDLEPLPDGKGEVILDPTWLQFSQAKDGFGAEGGDFGGGGEEGDPDYEGMLGQFEDDDEEENEQGGEEASGKPSPNDKPAEIDKSYREWTVTL
jgi:phage portal protein BeeE